MTLKCLSGLNPSKKHSGVKKKWEWKRNDKNHMDEWQKADVRKNRNAKKQNSLLSRKEFTTTTRDEWEYRRIIRGPWRGGRETLQAQHISPPLGQSLKACQLKWRSVLEVRCVVPVCLQIEVAPKKILR